MSSNAAIIAALITAAFGLVGGWLGARYGARTALVSWRRSRQDVAVKQAVELIQELSTDLAGLSHCAMWLTWRARFDPNSLEPKHLDRYEDDTYQKVPRLLGNLAALAALDDDTANSLQPFVNDICKLDGEIALAMIGARDAEVEKLGALYDRSKESYEELLKTLTCRTAHMLNNERHV